MLGKKMLNADVLEYLKETGFVKCEPVSENSAVIFIYGKKCSCCGRFSEIHIYDDGEYFVYDVRKKSDSFNGYKTALDTPKYKTNTIETVEDVKNLLLEVFGGV